MLIVLTHGCFDILHPGHLHHLKESRKLGDVLIVSVTADEFVNKGPDRPKFELKHRLAMLRELRCVDSVVASHAQYPDEIIRAIRPNIYTKHREYEGKLPEQELVEELGGKVVFTDWKVFSSRELCASL